MSRLSCSRVCEGTTVGWWRWLFLVVVVLPVASVAPSLGAEMSVLLNFDDNTSTGCTVITVDGNFDGVESVLTTTFDDVSDEVTAVTTSDCVGGVLAAPVPVVGLPIPWPVGIGLGEMNADVIETSLPLSVPMIGTTLRMGFVTDNSMGVEDALLTVDGSPGGAPLFLVGLDEPVVEIPTASTLGLLVLFLCLGLAGALILRRYPGAAVSVVLWGVVVLSGGGVLWALGTILLDGDPTDWIGIEDTVGMDAVGDAIDVDIVAGFAVLSDDGTTLAFRVDAFRDVPPTAVDDAVAVLEDSGLTAVDALANDTDPDGGPLLIEAVAQPSLGTVAIVGGGTSLTYQVDPDVCNDGSPTDDFTYTLNGGSTATVAVTVTCVNDEPSFTAGAGQTVDEDDGPQSVVGWATAIDDGDGGTQVLSFDVTNDNNALFSVQPAIDATTGTLSFETAPDASGLAMVTVVLTDDGGTANGGDDASPPQFFTITVTPMNDPPVCAGGGSVTVFMEDGGPVVINNALLVTDADDTDLQSASMVITNLLDPGLEALAAATGGTSIMASYVAPTLTLSGVDTVANYEQVLRSVTYDNSSQAPNSTNRIVSCVVSDAAGSGPSDSMTVQVVSVNDPPMVTNATISYTAIGNTLLRVDGPDADNHDSGLPGRIASSEDLTDALVAAGPSDPDSVSLLFTPKSSEATDQGGLITLDDDGDFYYVPPIGFTGVDTETLEIVDGDGGMVAVALEITVNDVVWYVEDTIDATNNPAGNADGRSTDAFQTLAAAEAASGEDDYILLFETDAPLDQGIILKSGQKLYGQRVEEETISLLPAGLLLEELMDTNARPQIHRTTGIPVSVDASAAVMNNVEIRHLDLESGDDDAIQITTANGFDASVVIDENVVGAAGTHGLDVNSNHDAGTTVEISLTDNVISSSADAISIVHSGGGDLELILEDNVDLTSAAGAGLDIDGSAAAGLLTITSFFDNSVHQDTAGDGVRVTVATFDDGGAVAGGTLRIGTPGDGVGGRGLVLDHVLGGLGFTDLDIDTSGGAGLLVDNSGQAVGDFGLTSAAGTISATGGAGLDLDPLTVGLAFDSVSSTNSATQGIRLNDVEGTLTIVGGAIAGAVAEAFLVDQDTILGALNVTYSGTIANASNRLLHVDGYPAGTLTLDGVSLTETGTGIRLNDVDGTVNVTAATSTIINGSGHGILIEGDSDGLLNFDDVSITNGALAAIQIDGGGAAAGAMDFDNVDVTFATNAQRMVLIQGLAPGASVNFDGASALTATDGSGILVTGNGSASIVFAGPVDLGSGVSPLSDDVAFQMTANAGTSVQAADLDVFASGQTAVLANGTGTLNLDQLSINTPNNSAGLILSGILSLVDVDQISCAHSSNCVDLTSLAAGSLTTFAGVSLNCSGGTCFNANAARTVEVTGSTNTITATNAVGLSLVGTTIGSNHATFQRIASGGAANGILLSSTGSSGNFIVTGTGAADSGGLITGAAEGISLTGANNISLTEVAITNSTGIGLDASMVSGLILDSLRLDGAGSHGINGESVTNFTLRNGSVVRNAGDADEEHGIRFRDLFGTSLIENTLIELMEEDGIEIINDDVDDATIDVLTVHDSTIQTNNAAGFGENGITARAQDNGNLRVIVDGTTIQNCDGDGINGAADGTDNNGFLDLQVIASTIQNNGARGVVAANANNQDMDVKILDRTTIQGNITTPVTIVGNQAGTVNLTIDNTTGLPADDIVITGSQNVVGGVAARCLEITADDDATMVARVDRVVATDCDFAAIRALSRNTASLDLTVTDSSFTVSGAGFEEAVTVVAGVGTVGDTGRICLNMLSNTATTGGGILDDYRLRTRQATNVFQLQNFVGNGAVAGDVVTWVNTTKSNIGSALISIDGAAFTAAGNCLLPP